MAKSVTYSMNQFRTETVTKDKNIYSPLCDIAVDYTETQISDDSATLKGYTFRDPSIKIKVERYATAATEIKEETTALSSDKAYKKNRIYYVKLAVPRNKVYDCEYNLKLYNKDKSEYQLIKNFSVAKNLSESSGYTHDVVLFQPYSSEDGTYRGYEKTQKYNDGVTEGPLLIGRIPIYGGAVPNSWEFNASKARIITGYGNQKPSGGILTSNINAVDYADQLVYLTLVSKDYTDITEKDESYTDKNRKFFYSDGTKWMEVVHYNYANLETTWSSDDIESEDVIIEAVFSPKEDDLTILAVEMIRNAEDYNISTIDNNVKYYGRTLKLDVDKCELRTITNIIGTLTDISTDVIDVNGNVTTTQGSFSRIGVWGRSNGLTAIESEEFRIGANGFYEVCIDDGEYSIERFGVVVKDIYDKFVIEYEYPTSISYTEN